MIVNRGCCGALLVVRVCCVCVGLLVECGRARAEVSGGAEVWDGGAKKSGSAFRSALWLTEFGDAPEQVARKGD